MDKTEPAAFNAFMDHRGVIRDIVEGPIDCITEIFTKAGKIRGNHVHKLTTQWTYVISGGLLVRTVDSGLHYENRYGPGELHCTEPGVQHAWKAFEDTLVLVFTRGPRSGAGYESDTYREGISLL